MPSVTAQVFGYILLAAAAAGMAIGAAGLFAPRMRSVAIHSAILQWGYVVLGLAAGLLAPAAGFSATVFQLIAGAAGVGLMWLALSAISSDPEASLPLPQDAAPPAWCVFCLALSCASLVGLPPLAGLPAKVAIIHAGLQGPSLLFIVTIGATALGVVSLWAYSGMVLPMIRGRVRTDQAAVSRRVRVAVDALIAVIIALGLVPYIGFAIGAAVAGGQ